MLVGGEKKESVTEGNCNKRASYVFSSESFRIPRLVNVNFCSAQSKFQCSECIATSSLVYIAGHFKN